MNQIPCKCGHSKEIHGKKNPDIYGEYTFDITTLWHELFTRCTGKILGGTPRVTTFKECDCRWFEQMSNLEYLEKLYEENKV